MENNLTVRVSEIIERQKNTICKLAFCYVKNMEDVQDIYQMVFEKYLRAMPEFKNVDHEKAWFITTTINTCKTYCTTAWKRRVTSLDNCELEYHIESKQQSESAERDDQVLQVVLGLPEKYRLIIHLYYYEEYSTVEIAEMTHMSLSAVKVRLNRARNMLKEKLTPCKIDGGISDAANTANV